MAFQDTMLPMPVPFAHPPLRHIIEETVSDYLRRPWTVQSATDLADLASHPSALLSDGAYSVFAKLSEAANGAEQFEVELAALRLLSEHAGVFTPTPIGICAVPRGSLLL